MIFPLNTAILQAYPDGIRPFWSDVALLERDSKHEDLVAWGTQMTLNFQWVWRWLEVSSSANFMATLSSYSIIWDGFSQVNRPWGHPFIWRCEWCFLCLSSASGEDGQTIICIYKYMEKNLKWYPKSSKCRIYFSLETYWNPWWLGSAPFQRDGFLVTPRFASLSQQLLECALDSQGQGFSRNWW